MATINLIEKMKSNVSVTSSNGVKSLYDYEKIKKNSKNLFKNSNLPALIERSKNFSSDEDLTKKVRFNLRKILKNLINDCNKTADKKESFLTSFNALKNFHSQVYTSDIFSADSLTNSENRKEFLTDIFTLAESYKEVKKVQPAKKTSAKVQPAQVIKEDKKEDIKEDNK